MKILELKVENVKRLKAVHLAPNGANVVIGGDNAQGKSSVLDSILYALGGLGAVCDKPIRDGASKAEIEVDVGEFRIVRRFSQSGGATLTVKTREGASVATPQGLLDRLVGQLAFDPFGFSRLDTKAQRATLAQLAGLDTSALDAEHAKVFEERSGVNRDVQRLTGAVAGKTVNAVLPLETEDASGLLAKIEAADVIRRRHDCARNEVAGVEGVLAASVATASAAEAALRAARLALDVCEQRVTDAHADMQANRTHLEQIREDVAKLVDPDTTELKTRILNLSERNRQIGENNRVRGLHNELGTARARSAGLTDTLAKIARLKSEAIARAKMPLPGLAVAEDGVWLNGVPFKQASTSEQVASSAAIGMALNPTLRVMLIRDGSLLDAKSLAALSKIAAAQQTQLWIERIGDGSEVSVVIEDGMVKENRLVPTASATSNNAEDY